MRISNTTSTLACLVLFLMTSSIKLNAQTTYVPDDNFEQALIALGHDEVLDDYVNTEEMASITYLNVSNKMISSLEGIEDCINLINLRASWNLLSDLDISKNTKLEKLDCRFNKIKDLDVTQNIDLIELYCADNLLTDIDIIQNTQLELLISYKNKITDIDVSQNINLKYFSIGSNLLTEIDVSQNSQLERLFIPNNVLSEIDVSKNLQLKEIQCSNNNLSECNVTQNKKLEKLNCHTTTINELDISQNKILTTLVCNNNNLTELNTSQNHDLIKLDCKLNNLSELDLFENSKLEELDCSSNPLGALDVTHNKNLEILFCSSNSLNELDVTQNTKLRYLHFRFNQINDIDLSNNKQLFLLLCVGNNLTEINLNTLPKLEVLNCSSNDITEIDVSNNPLLKTFSASSNLLEKFPVGLSSLTKLSSLGLDNNSIGGCWPEGFLTLCDQLVGYSFYFNIYDGQQNFISDEGFENFCASGTGSCENQNALFVDQNAIGANDGSSWSDAFVDFQSALDIVNPYQTINIAEGAYIPSVYPENCTGCNTDRYFSFFIPDGITVKGGFPTGGGERDPEVYQTIFSGDIGIPNIKTDNVFHVLTSVDNQIYSEMDGVTIQDGYANFTSSYQINNVNVRSDWGGGSISIDSKLIFENCQFKSNYAKRNGGAIYMNAKNSLSENQISNCYFESNNARNGGGIWLGSEDQVNRSNIKGCSFSENNSSSYGHSIYFRSHDQGIVDANIEACWFTKEGKANQFSAVYLFSHANSTLQVDISNSIFNKCLSTLDAPVRIDNYNSTTDVDIVQCTFSGNTGNAKSVTNSNANGGFSEVNIFNSILYNGKKELINAGLGASINLGHSIVSDSQLPNGVIDLGGNLLATNPYFVAPIQNNLHLQSSSPALNAGDNSLIPAGIITDFDGEDRIADEIVDMGAFEDSSDDGKKGFKKSSSGNIYMNDNWENAKIDEENTSLLLYPNPAYQFIHIRTNHEISTYSILDLHGKVWQRGILKNGQIDILNLAPGVYYFQSGENDIQRFVKM